MWDRDQAGNWCMSNICVTANDNEGGVYMDPVMNLYSIYYKDSKEEMYRVCFVVAMNINEAMDKLKSVCNNAFILEVKYKATTQPNLDDNFELGLIL